MTRPQLFCHKHPDEPAAAMCEVCDLISMIEELRRQLTIDHQRRMVFWGSVRYGFLFFVGSMAISVFLPTDVWWKLLMWVFLFGLVSVLLINDLRKLAIQNKANLAEVEKLEDQLKTHRDFKI